MLFESEFNVTLPCDAMVNVPLLRTAADCVIEVALGSLAVSVKLAL